MPNELDSYSRTVIAVEDAIDRPIEITVWPNGALVDAVVVPRELAVR